MPDRHCVRPARHTEEWRGRTLYACGCPVPAADFVRGSDGCWEYIRGGVKPVTEHADLERCPLCGEPVIDMSGKVLCSDAQCPWWEGWKQEADG